MAALDGLRGLAAFAVLLMHCMLVVPAALSGFDGTGGRSGLVWLVTFTPLHIFWAGTEAVFIFFVLSGFVLTRAAESLRFTWRAYYPSRLLRLYLPVAGAIGVAAVLFAVVPETHAANASWWLLDQQSPPLDARNLVHSLVLVRGAGLLPPLWSLKWEVIFSLVLPLAVYGAARRWRIGLAQTVVLLGLTLLGSDSLSPRHPVQNYLLYLPMFGVGAVMAHQHELLARIGGSLTRATGTLAAALGIVLLTLSWTARDPSGAGYRPAAVLGAALIVFAFGYWKPMRTVAETRPLQWLGRRSFSLYLVHFPIVVCTAILLGSRSRFAFLIAVPLSLLAAHAFFRLVEGPSHRFSQAVKTRLATGHERLGHSPVAQG